MRLPSLKTPDVVMANTKEGAKEKVKKLLRFGQVLKRDLLKTPQGT